MEKVSFDFDIRGIDWAHGARPRIEVVKPRDLFDRAIALGVLVRARAGFWLDEITRKVVELFNEYFLKPEPVSTTDKMLEKLRASRMVSLGSV